ncbi:E2F-associated phosphoprotein [Latimeria chalumnae]|uniref:E2F associated phosphoprotein n=1 Tax=Latimeria chalumnae TaxID=7897 RepID=H3BF99_LATCH|nr:PREDICTED: E2F-associated phosphoprotein [Latimeria chalumnae]|eukprot:XP_005989256.1 PREDICTED: E2F-associated phosphoprotein [Latimeria chalumnae]
MNRGEEYDSYEVEEPSDEEGGLSSSEDELDVLLHGTPDQKRKLLREYLTGESESSSEDEFEKEMEAELNSTMKTMEGSWTSPVAEAGNASDDGQAGRSETTHLQENSQPQYYDNIYFDTDDEDEDAGTQAKKKTKKHRILTNDELLYDPDEDDRDQAWVDAQRRSYRGLNRKECPGLQQQSKPRPAPTSDAVLNCPACMTTLCLDCQRHEQYRTQYRAMFVMNCTVNKEEVLKYKGMMNKKKKNKHKRAKTDGREIADRIQQEEEYHPVKCSECSTEVAVFDKDEVYHFFNVIASYC